MRSSPENCELRIQCVDKSADLFHMIENQLGHFKHGDLFASVENFLQLRISIDPCFVRRILKTVRPDVVPKFAGDLRSGNSFVADDCRQFFVRLHGLHESRAGFPFALGSFSHKFCRKAKPRFEERGIRCLPQNLYTRYSFHQRNRDRGPQDNPDVFPHGFHSPSHRSDLAQKRCCHPAQTGDQRHSRRPGPAKSPFLISQTRVMAGLSCMSERREVFDFDGETAVGSIELRPVQRTQHGFH